MIVTRIFAGADGRARIERREVPLQPDRSGRATSPDLPASRLFFRDTPPAHVRELHNAPQRQFIFVAAGTAEVELDDGTRRRFGPGEVMFVEDTAGGGHITRTLGELRSFVHVPVAAGFDITRWPLSEN